MSADFNRFADDLLEIEGGYQNDSSDSGNYTGCKVGLGKQSGTNKGISTCFYHDRIKANPSVSDMKSITSDDAKSIYRKAFWDYYRLDEFTDQDIANNVMDMMVNAGPKRGIRILQETLNEIGEDISVDGGVGAITLASVNRQIRNDEILLFNTYTDNRRKYYNSLTHKPAHQIASWNNRLDNHFPLKKQVDNYVEDAPIFQEYPTIYKYPPEVELEETIPEKEEVVNPKVNTLNNVVVYNYDVVKHSAISIAKIGRIDPVVVSKDVLRLISIILGASVMIVGFLSFLSDRKNIANG